VLVLQHWALVLSLSGCVASLCVDRSKVGKMRIVMSTTKLRIVRLGFGCGIALAAVPRRPPISFYTTVARTEGYTYAAKVLGFVHRSGASFCRPCQPLALIRDLCIAV
jgi:hypothetical protein